MEDPKSLRRFRDFDAAYKRSELTHDHLPLTARQARHGQRIKQSARAGAIRSDIVITVCYVGIITCDSRVHTDRRTRAIPAVIPVVTRAAVTYSIRRRRRPSSVRPDDARLVDATTSTRLRWSLDGLRSSPAWLCCGRSS